MPAMPLDLTPFDGPLPDVPAIPGDAEFIRERHVIEGDLYDVDWGHWDLWDRPAEGEKLGHLLQRLEGERVRITVEVLSPKGDAE